MSHVRYGHRARPRVLDLVCPRCGALASAHKPSEAEMGDVIGDMSGTWQTDDWAIACRSCSLRMTEVAYADLPESFYRVTAGDVELWAFNRGHFEMLLRLLEGDSIEDHPYQWFATYAHGTWLEKSNRTRLAKRMRILLAETET